MYSRSFSRMISYLLVLSGYLCLIDSVHGHLQMSKPFPLRSSLNPNPPQQVDYDMRTPLSADGSNFPCKGYHKNIDGVPPVETYNAGSKYQITIEGSASHGGGSCQIALSYDNGGKFDVIQSMIGGCPLNQAYDFTIPANAPSGDKVLLAWIWFNRIGNREMYMNCALVKIAGGSGSSGTSVGPEIFKANIFGGGVCQTKEGTDPVFPNPGPQVVYGGGLGPDSPPTILQGCPGGNDGPAPQPNPSSKPPQDGPKTTSTRTTTTASVTKSTTTTTTPPPAPNPTNKPPSNGGNNTVTITVTETTTAFVTVTGGGGQPTPSPAPTGYDRKRRDYLAITDEADCYIGQVVCISSDRVGVCVDGHRSNVQEIGPVPTNARCANGNLVEDSKECHGRDKGQIRCFDNGNKYSICNGRHWIKKVVPRGTRCVDGDIDALF